MNIDMIHPRSIYFRESLGIYHLENNRQIVNDEKNVSVVKINCQQIELTISFDCAVLYQFNMCGSNHLFTCCLDEKIKYALFTCLLNHDRTNNSTISNFENYENCVSNGVTFFTDTIAKYYSFKGQIKSCKLPCIIENAWKLRNSILIERQECQNNEHIPSLFFATHILSEFTPVVYKDEQYNKGFVNDTRFRIVAICEKSFLLLAFDKSDGTFSMWCVRDALKEDYESLYDLHWDGSITMKADGSSRCYSGGSTLSSQDNSLEMSKIKTQFEELDSRSPLVKSLLEVTGSDNSSKNIFHSYEPVFKKIDYRRSITEPLYPKICLEIVHRFRCLGNPCIEGPFGNVLKHSTPLNFKTNGQRPSVNLSSIPRAFFAEDFFKRSYFCILKEYEAKYILHFVNYSFEKNRFIYLNDRQFGVLDAVYLSGLKIIVVLEENNHISLFSGVYMVCKLSLLNATIYEPTGCFHGSPQPMAGVKMDRIVKLSENVDNAFTMTDESGKSARLYLPELTRSELVKRCLSMLTKMLPVDVGMQIMCKWYSINRNIDCDTAQAGEWLRFVEFILENIGFRNKDSKGTEFLILKNVKDLSIESSNGDVDASSKRFRPNISHDSILDDKIFFSQYSMLALNKEDQLLFYYAHNVLFSLHLIYEVEKLRYNFNLNIEKLAGLNCLLSCCFKWRKFFEYYLLHNPELWMGSSKLPKIDDKYEFNEYKLIPDWQNKLDKLMCFSQDFDDNNNTNEDRYPIIYGLNEDIINIICIWLVAFRHLQLEADPLQLLNRHFCLFNFNSNIEDLESPLPSIQKAKSIGLLKLKETDQRVVWFMSILGISRNDLDRMNPGLAGCFEMMMMRCNTSLPGCIQPPCFKLMGREDLDLQLRIMDLFMKNNIEKKSEARKRSIALWSSIIRPYYSIMGNRTEYGEFDSVKDSEQKQSGQQHELLKILESDPAVQLLHTDRRIREAYRMLQSNSQLELTAPASVISSSSLLTINATSEQIGPTNASFETIRTELESNLRQIMYNRTIATQVGRGMLGARTKTGDGPLVIPPLCLKGRFGWVGVSGSNFGTGESGMSQYIECPSLSSMGPSSSSNIYFSWCNWPAFHNGVATGLMVDPDNPVADNVWLLHRCSTISSVSLTTIYDQDCLQTQVGIHGSSGRRNHVIQQQQQHQQQQQQQSHHSTGNTAASNSLGFLNVDASRIDLSAQQSGLVFGLALNGHLKKLSLDTISRGLKSHSEITNMSFLLGLCASKLGSRDPQLHKYICFQYRRLIPMNVLDPPIGSVTTIDSDYLDVLDANSDDQVPPLSRIIGIIGAGLLHFQSGDRKLAQTLLREIGIATKCQETDSCCQGNSAALSNNNSGNNSGQHHSNAGAGSGSDSGPGSAGSVTGTEYHTLAASMSALAAGLVLLGTGDDQLMSREHNPMELDRLLRYMNAGHRFVDDAGDADIDENSHNLNTNGSFSGYNHIFSNYASGLDIDHLPHVNHHESVTSSVGSNGNFSGLSLGSMGESHYVIGNNNSSSGGRLRSMGDTTVLAGDGGGSTSGNRRQNYYGNQNSIGHSIYLNAPVNDGEVDEDDEQEDEDDIELEGDMDDEDVNDVANVTDLSNVESELTLQSTVGARVGAASFGGARFSQSLNHYAAENNSIKSLDQDHYNMDVTGPSAAIALGLIFIGTGNQVIARHLQCPSTFMELDKMRSPILCMRQIAHGLIMWHSIRPDKNWVESMIPEFIRNNIYPKELEWSKLNTVNESYLELVMGSCFAMALRFAGTENMIARETMVNYIELLLKMRNDGDYQMCVNKNTINWVLSTLFLCATIVCAGSGNLYLLKLSRHLYTIDESKNAANYGFYLAVSMGIGLLFLGGGRLTLSNSIRSAAILVVAFYPRFPPLYSSSRYHLPALRHLYILVTRPRSLCAVDIQTNTATPINSVVKFKDGTTRTQDGYILYPPENIKLISELEIYDENNEYIRQVYQPKTNAWKVLLASLYNGGYIFIQRKPKENKRFEYLNKISLNQLNMGYQIMDVQCFIDFFVATAFQQDYINSSIKALSIYSKFIDYMFDCRLDIKEIFGKLSCVNLNQFDNVCQFYDWLQQKDLLQVWSLLKLSLDTAIIIQQRLAVGSSIKPLVKEGYADFLSVCL